MKRSGTGRKLLIPSMAALALFLGACGDPGSSGTKAPENGDEAASGEECEPIAGDDIITLEDDQELQTVDNVVAAVNGEAAEEDSALLAAVDEVADSLDTQLLIELNRAVDIDRQTSSEAAKAFAEEHELTAPEQHSGGDSVVVGAANFSESATVAELYAIVLEDAGYDVEVRTIGNRELYEPAIESGELTVVPEYVGTFTEFLNLDANGSDADALASSDLDETMEALEDLADEAGLAVGAPSEAADQNAYAVTTDFAEEYGVETLSELAEACGGGISLGGPPECAERPFCQPGLEDTYGMTITDLKSLDAGGPLSKSALRSGEVALGMVLSSDAELVTD